jgi:hypothetical protein
MWRFIAHLIVDIDELVAIGQRVGVVARRGQRRQRLLARKPRTKVHLAAEVGDDGVPGARLVLGQSAVSLLAIG